MFLLSRLLTERPVCHLVGSVYRLPIVLTTGEIDFSICFVSETINVLPYSALLCVPLLLRMRDYLSLLLTKCVLFQITVA